MESVIFSNVEPKKPTHQKTDGFQMRMMKTYFVDTDTKESKLGVKTVLVQNDKVSEYASELRVLNNTELRLALNGFLDIENVQDEALNRLANPNDSDIAMGYKPILRPRKSDVIAKCEQVKEERISLALEREALAKAQTLSPTQKDKRNEK